MSFTVTNTFQNSLTPAAFTSIGFTGTAGRSFLLVTFQSNSDLITGISDDAGNNYVQDASLDIGGNGRRAFRCQSISGAPTQIRVDVSSGTEQVHLSLVEVTGLAATSPFEAFTSVNDGWTTTHSLAYTTASANALALATIGHGTDAGTPTGTGGWTAFTHTTVERDGLYIADTGAAGSKNLTFTTSGTAQSFAFIVVYKMDASAPTVTTVSGNSATEGSAITHTVTLSGATSGSTYYAATLVGVTATGGGTDFTSDLASATYSNGVTFSAGNMVVPDAISSWTVTISTASDTLDEANETYTLTVGGVSGTGTITDDDASPALLIPGPVTVDSGDSVVASYTLGAVSGRVTQARLVLTDGTAVGGVDYTNTFPAATLSDGVTISAGVLSIPAGVGSFTITIPTAA